MEERTTGKQITINLALLKTLENECPKSEEGQREETYSQQIMRLITPAIKKAEREKERIKKTQYIEVD